MNEKQVDNSGVLFKNDKKLTDKHPDYKGTMTVAGREYWLSSWIKVSQKDGVTRYMSLALTPKEAAVATSAIATEDPEIPF